MKALCWVLLLGVFACRERRQTKSDGPDAVRDLLIDRLFWQKKTVTHPQTDSLSIHRFTLTNTSQRYRYQHIEIRFDYYDRAYHKIDSAVRLVEQVVGPRTAVAINSLETKVAKAGVTTATASIVNASAD